MFNLKFGKFQIERLISKCLCPLCKQKSENARNLSYYNCKLKIEGEKSNDEQVKMYLIANDGKCHSFKDNGDEDFTQWRFLEITAS